MKHAKHDKELSGSLGKPILTIILFTAVAIALGGLLAAGVFAMDHTPQSGVAGKVTLPGLHPDTLTFPKRAFIPLIPAATLPLPPPPPSVRLLPGS